MPSAPPRTRIPWQKLYLHAGNSTEPIKHHLISHETAILHQQTSNTYRAPHVTKSSTEVQRSLSPLSLGWRLILGKGSADLAGAVESLSLSLSAPLLPRSAPRAPAGADKLREVGGVLFSFIQDKKSIIEAARAAVPSHRRGALEPWKEIAPASNLCDSMATMGVGHQSLACEHETAS